MAPLRREAILNEESYCRINEIYKKLLFDYLQTKNEHSLYAAQQFSKKIIENNISPEGMASIHSSVLKELLPDLPKEVFESFDYLVEVMVGYGMAYREHKSLIDRQQEIESELEVAATMQQTFLPKSIPTIESVDMGIISVPASKVSGDYYHYVQDDNGCIGLAIADIIGKGIPAALCMSMIKYAMDSLPEQRLQPGALLESLNRVVEQNIDSNMFITMIYGSYDPREHDFYYSSAGHEPGFYYNANENKFYELETKGLVLGVTRETRFHEYHKKLESGDFIVLLSDGVTECRVGDRFIEREEITELIQQSIHLSSQEIVDHVYNELIKFQDFQLKDDFTLMILRRQV